MKKGKRRCPHKGVRGCIQNGNDDLMLKEMKSIIARMGVEGKRKLMYASKRILDEEMAEEGYMERDAEIRGKSREGFKRLKKSGHVTTNAADFEKAVRLMGVIMGRMKFGGKFRVLVEHDPELMATSFEFFD